MGRPLKTRKYQQDTGTTVDYGFPNDGTTDNDYSNNQPGIVGGYDSPTRVTATFSMNGQGTIDADSTSTTITGNGTDFQYCGIEAGSLIYVGDTLLGEVASITDGTELELGDNAAVDVTAGTWTFTRGPRNAYILRQKGKKKFMIVDANDLQDEGIAKNNTYFITNASDTDWVALGAGPDAAYGKIFTATADGVGLATNGTVAPVMVATLVQATPEGNEFSMEVYNDGDTYQATAITNHWVSSDEDDTSKYIATIFNSNGDVDPATGYTIVAVENWC
jgi:hypothetical protein